MLEIGMRAHDLPGDDIISLSDKIKELGIRTVQLALPKSIKNIDFSTGRFCPNLARYLKSELDRNRISVSVLGCYINPIYEEREKDVAKFCEFLKYAKYMNADLVGTETGGIAPADASVSNEAYEKFYQIFLDSLKKMIKTAESLGVRSALKGFPGIPSVRRKKF